jgi:hypothetical protein
VPRRWILPLVGGIAAAVFLAVGMTLARTNLGSTIAASVTGVTGPLGAAPAVAPPSARESVQLSGVPQMQRDPRLEAYLRAHRELGDSGVLPQAVMYLRAGED